ncbi:hypothetical protein FHS31_001156 [Sphingomonas vulcanisoli]|uniref:YbhB/YbcL family Raf kinase inhibitor-like protein n=1 Tax=Sphingomonas vulcanisoli TaxID=1658060 RepID=A0ABX0TTF7_9SPHN|nr:YbhB/YbcL family Raf kinase inhibitor-like protein [Sphingomonas vulcanisoli]NIJ07560.1 hypothetical protein [Sphingomonas vulcanisoli]
MLEHVPAWLGGLLHNVRAGHGKLVAADPSLGALEATLDLTSPAFADEGRLPIRFTADGAGTSPPLTWGEAPEGTDCFALIVEDPDAPAPRPLVHAVVWGIGAQERRLEEGAIVRDGAGGPDGDVGLNSFRSEGWLPPDPPRGHGRHDYVFQLFALSEQPDLGESPGRSAVVKAMAGKVLAVGVLIGSYSREEEASVGPAGALNPA